jgi:hypothetical protein
MTRLGRFKPDTGTGTLRALQELDAIHDDHEYDQDQADRLAMHAPASGRWPLLALDRQPRLAPHPSSSGFVTADRTSPGPPDDVRQPGGTQGPCAAGPPSWPCQVCRLPDRWTHVKGRACDTCQTELTKFWGAT